MIELLIVEVKRVELPETDEVVSDIILVFEAEETGLLDDIVTDTTGFVEVSLFERIELPVIETEDSTLELSLDVGKVAELLESVAEDKELSDVNAELDELLLLESKTEVVELSFPEAVEAKLREDQVEVTEPIAVDSDCVELLDDGTVRATELLMTEPLDKRDDETELVVVETKATELLVEYKFEVIELLATDLKEIGLINDEAKLIWLSVAEVEYAELLEVEVTVTPVDDGVNELLEASELSDA